MNFTVNYVYMYVHKYLFQQQLEINKKGERERDKDITYCKPINVVATLFSVFASWFSRSCAHVNE